MKNFRLTESEQVNFPFCSEHEPNFLNWEKIKYILITAIAFVISAFFGTSLSLVFIHVLQIIMMLHRLRIMRVTAPFMSQSFCFKKHYVMNE